MIPARGPHLLFFPAGAIFLALFVLPMAGLFVESFRLFEPGRIGSAIDAPFTIFNYSELLTPSFAGFFFQTLRISLLASLAGMFLSLPLAYWIARRLSPHWRRAVRGRFDMSRCACPPNQGFPDTFWLSRHRKRDGHALHS